MIKLGRFSGRDEETPSKRSRCCTTWHVLLSMVELAKLWSHRGCSQGTAREQTGDGRAQGTQENLSKRLHEAVGWQTMLLYCDTLAESPRT